MESSVVRVLSTRCPILEYKNVLPVYMIQKYPRNSARLGFSLDSRLMEGNYMDVGMYGQIPAQTD